MVIKMSDLINKQAVIDAFYQYPNVNWTTLDVMEKINEVPSTQPEHGHWVEDCRYYDLKCSKCGERSLCYFDEEELDYYLCRSKYCPNCGAKMDEVINE